MLMEEDSNGLVWQTTCGCGRGPLCVGLMTGWGWPYWDSVAWQLALAMTKPTHYPNCGCLQFEHMC